MAYHNKKGTETISIVLQTTSLALHSQNLSMIDRELIINSYLKEISTINGLIT